MATGQTTSATDLVDRSIAFEQGDMDQEEMVEFFQELVDDGLVFRLQGHYGRTAARLIEAGLVRSGRRDR